MILLSISPFIFIQCGSGGALEGAPGPKGHSAPAVAPRFHTGKAHRGSAVRPFRSI